MVTPQYKKTKDWALSSDWTRAPRKGRQFLHLSFKFRRMIGATKQIYIFVLQFTCLPKTWCFRCQRDSNLLQTRVFVEMKNMAQVLIFFFISCLKHSIRDWCYMYCFKQEMKKNIRTCAMFFPFNKNIEWTEVVLKIDSYSSITP
jgi:hypothetical protein